MTSIKNERTGWVHDSITGIIREIGCAVCGEPIEDHIIVGQQVDTSAYHIVFPGTMETGVIKPSQVR